MNNKTSSPFNEKKRNVALATLLRSTSLVVFMLITAVSAHAANFYYQSGDGSPAGTATWGSMNAPQYPQGTGATASVSGSVTAMDIWLYTWFTTADPVISCKINGIVVDTATLSYSSDINQTYSGSLPTYGSHTYHWGEINISSIPWVGSGCNYTAGQTVTIGDYTGHYVTAYDATNNQSIGSFGSGGGSPDSCVLGTAGTCIDTVTPPNGQNIATTSLPAAVGSTYYIAPSDFVAGHTTSYVSYQPVYELQFNALDIIKNIFGSGASTTTQSRATWHVDIFSSGLGGITATTSAAITKYFPVGAYRMANFITVPAIVTQPIDVFGLQVVPATYWGTKNIVASTTVFAVGSTTPQDLGYLSPADQVALTGTSTDHTVENQAGCVIFAATSSPPYFEIPFSISKCLKYMFEPNSSALNDQTSRLYATGLSRFPLGYITRFMVIVASSTPVEPPALTYTFGSSSPAVLQGQTYSVNIFDSSFIGSSSPLWTARTDDGQGKNIWDIVDTYFTWIVGVAVFLTILFDLTGIEILPDGTQETTEGTGSIFSRRPRANMSVVEGYKVMSSAKSSLRENSQVDRGSHPEYRGAERRRAIARNGIRHDAGKHRGNTLPGASRFGAKNRVGQTYTVRKRRK